MLDVVEECTLTNNKADLGERAYSRFAQVISKRFPRKGSLAFLAGG
jgi:hypothetical protein